MPFAATCDWTLARSVLLALLAWPVCQGLERGLRGSPQSTGWLLLLAAPFLLPELLIGYLLTPWVVGFPWRSEWACAAVLFLRSVPIGVITLWGTPASPISPAALHLRRMSCRSWGDRWRLWQCYLYGPIRRALPSVGLMFLITFQEFEAAALLDSVSWTDRLFTEHATGLSLAESVRFLARPLAMQGMVLLVILWSLAGFSRGGARDDTAEDEPCATQFTRRFSRWYAGGTFLVGAIGPLALLFPQLVAGWNWLMNQTNAWENLATEICTAGLVGVVAGLATWNVARGLLSNRCPGWLASVCSLPGLYGGLTVSLACLWISSRPMLHGLSSTPVCWVIALTVWLLPRAVLLQLWLARRTEPASMHLVEMLRHSPDENHRQTGRRWRWRWQIEPQIAACGLLCYWAYLDLTAAALLAPPGMASIMVRLYNFMHFGRSAAMSMEATLAMLSPLLLWGLIMAAARPGRRGWRS